jgi:hypothetical protein
MSRGYGLLDDVEPKGGFVGVGRGEALEGEEEGRVLRVLGYG